MFGLVATRERRRLHTLFDIVVYSTDYKLWLRIILGSLLLKMLFSYIASFIIQNSKSYPCLTADCILSTVLALENVLNKIIIYNG